MQTESRRAPRRAAARSAASASVGRRLEDRRVGRGRRPCRRAQGAEPGRGADLEAARRAHLGAVDRAGRELVQRLAARPRRQTRRPAPARSGRRRPARRGRARRLGVARSPAFPRAFAAARSAISAAWQKSSGHWQSCHWRDRPRSPRRSPSMNTSILIFDGLTALDAIGPYEVLRSVPGWEVEFVGHAPVRYAPTPATSGSAPTARSPRRPSPTSSSSPAATATARCWSDEEVLSWLREVDAPDQVDDLGLHRLAGARRRRPARGQAGDRPLALPRAAARLRRRPGRRPLRRGRQGDHRRRRLRRHRHGPAPGRPRGRPRGRRRRSSWASSTTPSRPSTPAPPPRPRPRSSRSSPPSPQPTARSLNLRD